MVDFWLLTPPLPPRKKTSHFSQASNRIEKGLALYSVYETNRRKAVKKRIWTDLLSHLFLNTLMFPFEIPRISKIFQYPWARWVINIIKSISHHKNCWAVRPAQYAQFLSDIHLLCTPAAQTGLACQLEGTSCQIKVRKHLNLPVE